jgi:hypothetical protein
MSDACEPRCVDGSLPMIGRKTAAQLGETADHDRQSGYQLQVAHDEHTLNRLESTNEAKIQVDVTSVSAIRIRPHFTDLHSLVCLSPRRGCNRDESK